MLLKKTALLLIKWRKHSLVRFLAFPLLTGIIYLLVNGFHEERVIGNGGIRTPIFAGLAIVGLYLMAEIILYFEKKKYERIYCDALLILLFFVVTIFVV